MTEIRYVLIARFDTKDQAKHASAFLVSLNPRSYCFSAFDDRGKEVWSETGGTYGAHDVRV